MPTLSLCQRSLGPSFGKTMSFSSDLPSRFGPRHWGQSAVELLESFGVGAAVRINAARNTEVIASSNFEIDRRRILKSYATVLHLQALPCWDSHAGLICRRRSGVMTVAGPSGESISMPSKLIS